MRMFDVGDVVRQLRKARGWTQEDLAREAGGLSPETIVNVEKNRTATTNTLSQIAVALGMTTAELYARTALRPPDVRASSPSDKPHSDVDDEIVDVSRYTPADIPVVAEGEANPQGDLFWSNEGVLRSDVEDRISRPGEVTDPRAYGVRVRGDSMLPIYRPGMTLIVSPNAPVSDGDEVYVQLVTGERLIKIARRAAGGWILESSNPAYEPRYVKRSEVRLMHAVVWARRRRTPYVNGHEQH